MTVHSPRSTGPFWYGKWSRNGQPVVRALGRAWVETTAVAGGSAAAASRRKEC